MTESRPIVSVITPALNQGLFIADAIVSVRVQDYEPIEHVVIDGGSSDSTVEVLRRYDHLVWISEPDEGQSHALNKGFERARGEIFGWLNADDLYLPGAIATAVTALLQFGAGLVYGDYVKRDVETGWERRVDARTFDLEWQLNEGNVVPQPAAFFTREAFEAVGGIDRSLHYAMDYDLWIRIGKRFPVVHVDAPLAVFRFHPASKTVSQNERFWREERAVARRHGGRALSTMYVEHVRKSRPRTANLLGRLSRGAEMVRRREFGRLLRRVGGTVVGR